MISFIFIITIFSGCISNEPTAVSESSTDPSDIVDYRYEMRQFVQGISAYMNAVDGIGREDFLYGYYEDNTATPMDDRKFMLSSMNIYLEYGKSVLVIDYCSSADKVQDSYDTNGSYGFISFATDERDLNSIPALPQWQQIINGNDQSYAKMILNAGFVGVYLDLIDAFEYYEKQ